LLTRSDADAEDEALAQSLSAARVDLNPHQVDAALFALRSPLSTPTTWWPDAFAGTKKSASGDHIAL